MSTRLVDYVKVFVPIRFRIGALQRVAFREESLQIRRGEITHYL